MKTDALSDIRSQLRSSAEMAWVRFQLILWLIFWAACLIVVWIGTRNHPAIGPMMLLCVSVLYLPIVVFWLVRVWKMFRSIGDYVLCPAELIQPHHAFFGRGLYRFMGVIETERDGRFAVETHALFHSGGNWLRMEDYLHRTVTLAWNRRTGTVVVIG